MAKGTVRVSEAAGERRRKTTLGRQKIEIKPIWCPEERHVCFAQRREGLFKKATEFCVLTGAQVAIVVFSPSGKAYSFGYPSVKAVMERYNRNPSTAAAVATRQASAMLDFFGECERLCEAIAAEARRRDELDAAARAAGAWTGGDDVHSWGMPRLVAMLAALERVQAEAAERAHEMTAGDWEAMIMHNYAAIGDGMFFTADSGAGSSRLQGGMSTQMMLLDGDVMVGQAAHAPCMDAPLPFPPMRRLPPDLSPPAPQLPFNCGDNGGSCYDHGVHGDDSGHGDLCGMEGCYGTMLTCMQHLWVAMGQCLFTDPTNNSEHKSMLN